nr:unnamed protein product [Digitaria exilis]
MAEHLLSTAVHRTMPGSYVRPESQRPRLADVVSGAPIPVVDLSSPDRAAVVRAIGDACRSHGFFQVLNHGIDAGLIAAVMGVGREFFRLPAEEKAKLYSDDPAKKIRLSTSFNVRKETVHNWRDYLRLHCHPLDQFVPDWPSNPPDFNEALPPPSPFSSSTQTRLRSSEIEALWFGFWGLGCGDHRNSRAQEKPGVEGQPDSGGGRLGQEVRELGFRLYAAISESLGLEASYMKDTLGDQEQHMAVNFYPRCPEPELTYGLPAHTDPNALTILLMDQDVAGLQVLHGGKWVAVNPKPGALIVNIGDQLQALSNGQYRSVWHRAVVNSDRERLSVASFLCPCNDVELGPARKLVTEETPAVYRSYTYDEYYKKFWSRNLDQEHCLELFRT